MTWHEWHGMKWRDAACSWHEVRLPTCHARVEFISRGPLHAGIDPYFSTNCSTICVSRSQLFNTNAPHLVRHAHILLIRLCHRAIRRQGLQLRSRGCR